MDVSAVIALLVLGISAVGFFYKVGRGTNGKRDTGTDKPDQVLENIRSISKKLDAIAEWQRESQLRGYMSGF